MKKKREKYGWVYDIKTDLWHHLPSGHIVSVKQLQEISNQYTQDTDIYLLLEGMRNKTL